MCTKIDEEPFLLLMSRCFCTLGALVTIPADRNQPHAAWEAYALRAGTGLRPYPPTASCPASTGHLLAVSPVHGATGGYTARRA